MAEIATRMRAAWLMLRYGDQWWYWTPEWQAGEREADADIAAGRTETFDNMADLIASLEIDPADRHPRDCAHPYGVCTCPAHIDHPNYQTLSSCEACALDGEMAMLRWADGYREKWDHRATPGSLREGT